MSYFNSTNCPPTRWGIQATHAPISYEEPQRNKVLFNQLPFLDPLLQPHWTSSTPLQRKEGVDEGGKQESEKLNLLEIIRK